MLAADRLATCDVQDPEAGAPHSGAISASAGFQSFAPSGAFSEKFTLENSIKPSDVCMGQRPDIAGRLQRFANAGLYGLLINPRAETAP